MATNSPKLDLRIIRKIQTGGYATVVLAHLVHRPERLFAVKRLPKHQDEQQQQQVAREQEVLGSLQHPFVVRLWHTFESTNHVNLVMEYCAGGDLFELLMSLPGGRMPQEHVVFYAASLVLTLKFLHHNGVIHRDLKLENVFLDADGFIRLGDFGFARKNGHRCQSFCGTIDYIAPEVLQHKAYSFAADFWSLGCVLYALLTGCSPFFCADSNDNVIQRVLHEAPRFPRKWSCSTLDFVKRLLIKDPFKRLGSGPTGIQELLSHDFFRSIRWNALLAKRMVPPYGQIPFARRASSSSAESVESIDADQCDCDGEQDEACFDRVEWGGLPAWRSHSAGATGFCDATNSSTRRSSSDLASAASCGNEENHPPFEDRWAKVLSVGGLLESFWTICTRAWDQLGRLCGSSSQEMDSVEKESTACRHRSDA